MEHINYRKGTPVVPFQGKKIFLGNLTPVLTAEQKAATHRELEQQFKEAFRKYSGRQRQAKYRMGNLTGVARLDVTRCSPL